MNKGYDSKVPLVAKTGAYERRIRDLDAILKYCRDRKIHTIARIAVFQDPSLARARPDLAVGNKGGGAWKDRKGLAWVDPASKEVWDYNIAIAKEAAARGFDEVQFDYVRFPTDGKMKTLAYPIYKGDVPKHEVIRSFFQYVDQQMKPVDVLTSADIFGLTTMVDDLPEPNPNPPLKAQVTEEIRRHDAARAAMQNRSTVIKQSKPSIHKPRRTPKGA